MNRGSGGQTRVLGAAGIRFNEAPIHESGKLPRNVPARIRTLQLQ